VLFATLGLGLALPFLLLGWVPALRRILPKPGKWMDTFRKVLAIPMGLTALALAWLTWRLGGTWFAVAALVLAMVAVALLMAWYGRRFYSGVAAIVAASFGVILLPYVFSPPVAAEESVLDAVPFSEAALADARASGKPVFVWFTADWCLTCKVNEGVAIERETTRSAFKSADVVAMRGDWTVRDPEITRFLTAHGSAGVPLYLWYKPGKDAQVLPQVLTPSTLTALAGQS